MFSSHSGQTLLIVVLVMVVALTVGLAVVLRSITNLRISVEEENSQRAFAAAEAGIEQALKTDGEVDFSDHVLDSTNNVRIKEVTVTSLGSTEGNDVFEFLINNGNPIVKNDATDVWLVEHNEDGSLNYSSGWQATGVNETLSIMWGDSVDANTCVQTQAALEVIVLSGESSSPKSSRYAFDPCSERRDQNKFQAPSDTAPPPFDIGNKSFTFKADISILESSKGILVRVIPLYHNTSIGVSGTYALPPQGKIIESTGIADTSVRKVIFYEGYPKVPAEFFPHGIFSTQ